MALRNVEYVSSSRLSCAGCAPSDVVLCVPDDKVAQPACVIGQSIVGDLTSLVSAAGLTRQTRGFVYGQLTNFLRLNNACGGHFYRYVFQYDDTQLVNPTAGLSCKDIEGVFCSGCLTDWVKDLVGETVTVQERTKGYITIRNQLGCEYTFRRGWSLLVQDGTTGDVTVTYPDGTTTVLQIPTCAESRLCFTGTDTASIDYNYNNATGDHSANVKLSALAGNDLRIEPDGLYVNISDANCAEVRACLSVLDTPTVDSVYNQAAGQFSANVIIDNTQPNQLVANANGLLVPPAVAGLTYDLTETGAVINLVGSNGTTDSVDICALVAANCPNPPITPVDTPSVDLTVSGVNNHTLQADVRVDNTQPNSLVIGPNGLLVPPAVAGNSDTLVDNGNRIFTHIAVNGVAVQFCQGITEVRTDNACGAPGVGPGKVIRSAQFNGCELILDAEPTSYFRQFAAVAGSGGFLLGAGTTTDLGSLDTTLVLNNPSPCYPMGGLILHDAGTEMFFPPGGNADVNYAWRQKVDVPAGPVAFDQSARVQFDPVPFNNFRLSTGRQSVFLLNERGGDIPPGGSKTLEGRVQVQVIGISGISLDFHTTGLRVLGWAMN